MSVKRIFVEKKDGFDVEARALKRDINENLLIKNLEGLRIINRYDIEGLNDSELEDAIPTIFSEPNADIVSRDFSARGTVYAVEYLPGQFDQRADSAAQCCSLLTGKAAPRVRCAKVYVLTGALSENDISSIQSYTVNPVEARLASLEPVSSLAFCAPVPSDVAVIENFLSMNDDDMARYHASMGFAMTVADLLFVRDYFALKGRNPFLSELKVIDTYWSDHCRHTTFLTRLEQVEIEDGPFAGPIKEAWRLYLDIRENVYAGRTAKDVTLMDMATIAAKEIKKRGGLKDLDQSEEINACSVIVDADINGKNEKWVVMFKNETHNHPTEIEPFGGAATCLGGAIRDPLSGRSYVYQAMRVTGAGNPLVPVADTLAGKLPQRKLTLTAAAGYSSYGNQIGLSTGQVSEIYDDGYIAKRLEIGAVVGAAPYDNIRRERPEAGDVIVLLGGATGRDGCGGATGSSKAHTNESLASCGAEVQKGNAPTERKLQRLFRSHEVSRLIKRCNDFGAGGVCVAIGELSEALDINLDLVPKKYDGLDGTELAISESQERMAVVLDKNDVDKFIAFAHAENLDATAVAAVTDTGRLRMTWRGKTIVDLERSFLDTNGVTQTASARITSPKDGNFLAPLPSVAPLINRDLKEALLKNLSDLSVCSQKGLSERFDSSIGKGTVLMPFGGINQLTPACAMAAKLPVQHGQTDTATIMSWGYNPKIARFSPFHGAYYAVAHSLVKLACAGADISDARLTQQEYFERLRDTDTRWGKPCAALLGSIKAQMDFGTPAIGGKDSMSGSFNELDVPPTLVNFSISLQKASLIISPEFKKAGSSIGILDIPYTEALLPDAAAVKQMCSGLLSAIKESKILAACPVDNGGAAAALCIMALGNSIGFNISDDPEALFASRLCTVVVEADADTIKAMGGRVIGTTGGAGISINGACLTIKEVKDAYTLALEPVFPSWAESGLKSVENLSMASKKIAPCTVKSAVPRVVLPVFPGTNCEIDTARAFEEAGAACDIFVIRSRTADDINASMDELSALIKKANILMLPGGFSGGDEPDGSGKFIATVLRNCQVSAAVEELLYKRDGLAMGICNGFQALIKTGLLPYGHIGKVVPNDPTLTYNTIGRHISTIARVRVCGVNSPWTSRCNTGEVYSVAISHGEGRFAADAAALKKLIDGGQVITQYCDLDGNASADGHYNFNGSAAAIEGIVSPDGRVLGKMGHTERSGASIAKNVPGNYDMQLFKAGAQYFK